MNREQRRGAKKELQRIQKKSTDEFAAWLGSYARGSYQEGFEEKHRVWWKA